MLQGLKKNPFGFGLHDEASLVEALNNLLGKDRLNKFDEALNSEDPERVDLLKHMIIDLIVKNAGLNAILAIVDVFCDGTEQEKAALFEGLCN